MFQPVAIQSWVLAEAAGTPPPTVAAKAAAVAARSEPRVPSGGRRRRVSGRARGTEGEAEHPVADAPIADMASLRRPRRLFNVMTILRKFTRRAPEECGSYCRVTRPGPIGPAVPVCRGNMAGAGSHYVYGPNGPPPGRLCWLRESQPAGNTPIIRHKTESR